MKVVLCVVLGSAEVAGIKAFAIVRDFFGFGHSADTTVSPAPSAADGFANWLEIKQITESQDVLKQIAADVHTHNQAVAEILASKLRLASNKRLNRAADKVKTLKLDKDTEKELLEMSVKTLDGKKKTLGSFASSGWLGYYDDYMPREEYMKKKGVRLAEGGTTANSSGPSNLNLVNDQTKSMNKESESSGNNSIRGSNDMTNRVIDQKQDNTNLTRRPMRCTRWVSDVQDVKESEFKTNIYQRRSKGYFFLYLTLQKSCNVGQVNAELSKSTSAFALLAADGVTQLSDETTVDTLLETKLAWMEGLPVQVTLAEGETASTKTVVCTPKWSLEQLETAIKRKFGITEEKGKVGITVRRDGQILTNHRDAIVEKAALTFTVGKN